MLSDMFSDPNKIKISDMVNDDISEVDLKSLKKLNRSIFLDHIVFLIFALGGIGLFLSFIIDELKTGNTNTNINVFIFLIISLVVLIGFLIFCIKTLKETIHLNYKKAQYGIVKSKYTLSQMEDRNYYLNVEFPNKSVLGSVNIGYTDNLKLKVGEKVLVVSFNGKIAYAIIPKK